MRYARFLTTTVVAVSLSALQAEAQPSDSLSARVDKVFAQWDRNDSPGCAVSVVRDGKVVYTRGYGMADLEHDVPITPATIFYIGSDSKHSPAGDALLAKDGGDLSSVRVPEVHPELRSSGRDHVRHRSITRWPARYYTLPISTRSERCGRDAEISREHPQRECFASGYQHL